LDIDLKGCIHIQILHASPLIDSLTHTFYCYLYIPVRLQKLHRKALDQLHTDEKINLLNNKNQKIAKTGNKGISKLALHFDSLEHGTEAFMQWLCSDDKMSASRNPIILKQFVDNKYTVLYDNTLGQDVIIETHDGVPFCKTCNTDDCGHVGFTILLEQKFENDGSVLD
jgi:hypothetical protein